MFATLIHESGHAIRISYSDVADSVMFAYYNGKSNLGNDDILAVQNVYGRLHSNVYIITTSSPPSSPTSREDDFPSDHFNTLLLVKKRLYVSFEKWL